VSKSDTSARIKVAYVLADDDVIEPRLSVADWADLKRGFELFHAHKFWDSHEAWELVWRRHKQPSRIFFQGLIQTAAACHQIEQGVYHGAVKHCNNALLKIRQFPDGFLGVGVLGLVHAIEVCRDMVERLGKNGLGDFDTDWFPVIDFAQPRE
jgi:hypothetical protein